MTPGKTQEDIGASHASMEGIPQPLITPPRETSWRSLAKAFSWRVTGSIDTFILALLFTGNLKVSAAIGGTEVFTKIALYYLHERAWGRINLGLSNAGVSQHSFPDGKSAVCNGRSDAL